MKTIRPLFLGVFLAATAALLSGCAGHTSIEPLGITIDRMKGNIRYSMDGKIWQPLTNTAVIKEGTAIQTGTRSLMDISFGKKPTRRGPLTSHDELVYSRADPLKTVRIFENTSLKIEKAVKKTHWYWMDDNVREEIRLNLDAGIILGSGASAFENPKYEIEFTNGLVTFSNKTIYYTVSASGILNVVEGNATISMTDKNTTCKVSGHQTFDPATGVIGELSADQIRSLYMTTSKFDDGVEWVTMPPKLGQGPGMGGALRKF